MPPPAAGRLPHCWPAALLSPAPCLQGRDRFAERWGFDVKLGQPLPNHSRYQWEAVTCT